MGICGRFYLKFKIKKYVISIIKIVFCELQFLEIKLKLVI